MSSLPECINPVTGRVLSGWRFKIIDGVLKPFAAELQLTDVPL
jgi:hypothetical protein